MEKHMSQNNEPSKRKRVKISYWWQLPVPADENSSQNWVLACSLNQMRLPRFGQIITWRLAPLPRAGQDSLVVIARGIVSEVSEIKDGEYFAVLERNCKEYQMDPLTYEELHNCLSVAVTGFHPTIGCLEGPLVRLLPECDLAGIADPLVRPQGKGEPVVWVDWSTICKVTDLEEALHD
jgi:hypothetical protein